MRRRFGSERLRRPGFTLVELLVVIAIIAILVSLTAAAVMKARLKGYEVQNRNNIQQLSTSIQGLVSKTGVDFIPSTIVLRNDLGYNLSNQTDAASFMYLKRLWPRLQLPNPSLPASATNFINWCPNDSGAAFNSAYVLQGDQCLVFFLGGIQLTNASGVNACIGFSTNATNPVPMNLAQYMGNGGQFTAPFFDFPVGQLVAVTSANENLRSSKFYTFLDPYGSPYAYFSSRGNAGGLNNAYAADCSLLPVLNANGVLVSGANVIPYQHIPATNQQTNFYNPQGFQIISAGYGSSFDTNGVWDYKTGNPFVAASVAGYYSLTNFSQFVLGAGNP